MKTLDEAWLWYRNSLYLSRLVRRVADRYWDGLPWEEMSKDESFKTLKREDVSADSHAVERELKDLSVFVMFSVFEAIARDHVKAGMAAEVAVITNPALKQAARELMEDIEEGSFFNNVLRYYVSLDHKLAEEVNQVRKYRNWVAHGRRPEKKEEAVEPKVAYERLRKFLELIRSGPRP